MAKIVTFGEIMLRLCPSDHQRFIQANTFQASFGGGEANVAVSLANFGLESEFVSRLPHNDLGNAAKMELQKYNVGVKNISLGR